MTSASFPSCLGPWLFQHSLQGPVLPKTTLRGCLQTDVFAPQLQHRQIQCPKPSWGCDPAHGSGLWLHKRGGFHQVSAVWLRGETHPHLFLQSQMLHRTLLFICCRLQQVLLGRRVKVEGALFSHYWSVKCFAEFWCWKLQSEQLRKSSDLHT